VDQRRATRQPVEIGRNRAIAPGENVLDFFLANSRLKATGAALAGED